MLDLHFGSELHAAEIAIELGVAVRCEMDVETFLRAESVAADVAHSGLQAVHVDLVGTAGRSK